MLPIIHKAEKDRKIRVMIADDHSLYRNGLKTTFRKFADIDVVGEAGDGRQLLELLAQQETDVVTLDLQMPVMDGIETLPILLARHPHIKVIIVCMHNDSSIIARMMEAGAHSYVTCEEGGEQVYRAITECYEKGFYINNTVRHALLKAYFPELYRVNLTDKEMQLIALLSDNKIPGDIAKIMGLHRVIVEAMIEGLLKKTKTYSVPAMVKFVRLNISVKYY